MFKPKEKGQGLVEYALILVLVSIVVIAALMILGPILERALSPNKEALSKAPLISQSGNPIYLSSEEGVNRFIVVDYKECTSIVSGNYLLKAGTTYEHPESITVTRNGDTYEICNNVRGTHIDVAYALYDRPK